MSSTHQNGYTCQAFYPGMARAFTKIIETEKKIRLGSTYLYNCSDSKEESPGGGQRPSTNHTRGLAARWLFRVPPCRKGTIHLQTSMSSPEFEPSPYGTAVRIANHYTDAQNVRHAYRGRLERAAGWMSANVSAVRCPSKYKKHADQQRSPFVQTLLLDTLTS
ncbi:hypothetical protein TNCV_4144951 [Trichonephila clavipes]|nr:hypothetical protein TNCV_4144951 [Trichonephila clavipes]